MDNINNQDNPFLQDPYMQKLRLMKLKFFELSRKVRVLLFSLKLQKNLIDGLTDDIGNLGKFAEILDT